jgi:hypothetical protein
MPRRVCRTGEGFKYLYQFHEDYEMTIISFRMCVSPHPLPPVSSMYTYIGEVQPLPPQALHITLPCPLLLEMVWSRTLSYPVLVFTLTSPSSKTPFDVLHSSPLLYKTAFSINLNTTITHCLTTLQLTLSEHHLRHTTRHQRYILPTKSVMAPIVTPAELAEWEVRNMFVQLVRNDDARPILALLPSYDTLTFSYNKASNTVTLYMGEYGDSQVLAYPDGSVQKIVIGASKIRKPGTIIDVTKPIGGHFRAVASFGWSDNLQERIFSPMGREVRALVLMNMHIWAIKEGKEGLELTLPVQQDLHDALVLLRSVFEKERLLPFVSRKIPAEVLDAYHKGPEDVYKKHKKPVAGKGA